MDKKKDQPGKVSSCFDGPAGAEMMLKIMNADGVGSLCEGMMRSLVNKCGKGEEKPREMPRKKRRAGGPAQEKNKDQKGGPK
jgi:hypothetical protein